MSQQLPSRLSLVNALLLPMLIPQQGFSNEELFHEWHICHVCRAQKRCQLVHGLCLCNLKAHSYTLCMEGHKLLISPAKVAG